MLAKLEGRKVLVVEDDYLQASALCLALEAAGTTIIGPFPVLADGLVALRQERVDVAILDIHLAAGERAYMLADRLRDQGVPFVFVTGYQPKIMPSRFRSECCLLKPIATDAILTAAAFAAGGHPAASETKH